MDLDELGPGASQLCLCGLGALPGLIGCQGPCVDQRHQLLVGQPSRQRCFPRAQIHIASHIDRPAAQADVGDWLGMYISSPDCTFGEHEWRPFVERQGFGHLAAAGRGRDVPVIVPTQFILDADLILLHLVAPNPIFEALAEQPKVMLSVAGDWVYIPSAWKAIDGEDPRLGIPTTYYGAVQLVGSARVDADPAAVAAVLRRQLAVLQPDLEVADPAESHGPKLKAIRAITVTVEEVRAKFKYGGNVDRAHRQAVIDHLLLRSGPGDRSAAAHAQRRGERSDAGREPLQ